VRDWWAVQEGQPMTIAHPGLRAFLAFLIASLGPGALLAADRLPRSILVLNESAMVGPFYSGAYQALRSKLNATSPISIFLEQLELERFGGERYEKILKTYLESKYGDQPLGVIVAFGSAALDFVLRHRIAMWSGVPIVFVMVDETYLQRLSIPSNVTGRTARVKFRDLLSAANFVVPNLEQIAIVGDRWEIQTAFRHFKDEIPVVVTGLEIIDLIGMPMRELRKRVSVLPERTAIVYTSIFSDGEGTSYPPVDALGFVAQAANRPIVVAAETFVGLGGIGGYVLTPVPVGEEAADLVLRILNGESASAIPIAEGNVVRPIFDWRQMQQWGVSPSRLPPGSEIRFREPTAWERYRWQITTTAAVIVLQTALITGLVYERRRRRNAEVETRQRMSELAHMNRYATAGELSSSIAHELNQPLGAILSNAETAELLLNSPSANLEELKEILADIRRDDQRANEVILRLRRLLKKAAVDFRNVDLNDTVREVLEFLEAHATEHDITLVKDLEPHGPRVKGDRIQLQQVIVNLVVNGMEAIGDSQQERQVTIRTHFVDGAWVELSVADTGAGIPLDKIDHVFDPFFTTKEHGMGMGLSIARTIVGAHSGRIWVENQVGGGAKFRVKLPSTTASQDGSIAH
jgi:signal transduction histidine kinase